MSRELIELAALFITTGGADLFVSTLSHNRVGPVMLFGLGGLLNAAAAWRPWWTHRARPDPARDHIGEHPSQTGVAWRVRATVRDVPGSLAGVPAALAAHRCDIASLQVLAVPDGVVDEFPVRAPAGTTAADIATVTELIAGTVLRLADTDGGVVVTRAMLPFTPAEFARAKAVLDLERRLSGAPAAWLDRDPAPEA